MIVNHTYKFIFVHVPKNAGTSVTQALSTLSSWRDLELGGTQLGEAIAPHYMKRFGLRKHSTASQIRKVVGEEIWSSYHKFGFVRDPYSRLQSLWSFLRKWKDWPESDIMNSFASIDEFVTSDFFLTGGPDQLLRPQSYFLDADLDFLGSCSATTRDFQSILDTVGIPAPKQPAIGFVNDSRSKDNPLSDDSRHTIASLWAADFKLLNTLKP
jgi:hypothetical protein